MSLHSIKIKSMCLSERGRESEGGGNDGNCQKQVLKTLLLGCGSQKMMPYSPNGKIHG